MPQLANIGKIAEVAEGESKAMTCGDEVIAVFNVGGTFYACGDVCPHAGGPLHQGFIGPPSTSGDTSNGPVVTCPWHGWTFELGVNADRPKDGVTRYRVIVEGEDILLELPEA